MGDESTYVPEYRALEFNDVSIPTMRHHGVVWVAIHPIMDGIGLNKRAYTARARSRVGMFGMCEFRMISHGKKKRMLCMRQARIGDWLESIDRKAIGDAAILNRLNGFAADYGAMLDARWAEEAKQEELDVTAPTIESTAIRAFEFDSVKTRTFEFQGEPWVAMKPIIEGIGLDWKSQSAKFLEQKAKFNCGVITTVGRDGKPREMLCIPVRKFPLWLVSVNPEKVDEAIKPRLEMWQEQSGNALHDFWTKGVAMHPDLASGLPAWVASTDFAGVIAAAVAVVIGSEDVRGMIGGIVKSNLAKQLQPLLGNATGSHMSTLAVAEKYKVPQAGRKRFIRILYHSLKTFYDANGFAKYKSGGDNPRWFWQADKVSAWHQTVGRKLIADYMATAGTPLFKGSKLKVHEGGRK